MDRTLAALAGLLHDIGKFWQRAAASPDQPIASGYEAFRRLDGESHHAYGRHGAHATWSAAFVRQFVPPSLRDIGYAVLYHHNPQDFLSKVVALADRLASGERADETDKQPRNLLSIFCQVGEDDQQRPEPAYFPLRPLALDERTLFPSPEVQEDQAAYGQLWEQFEEDVAAQQAQDDAEAYIESLYHLLYRYAWCVPSAFYRSTPDISLFDHSRVTAAVAACLVEQSEDTIGMLLSGRQTDDTLPLAYLLEGDISGVQKFIYTLTSKGVAKGLRGRSFYLQLLTEAIARYVLREMALPVTNLIYAGGGHFYLLIPPGERERIPFIQQALDQYMLAHHDGALYVALGYAELRAADFQADAFSSRWREAGQSVGQAKRRRFADFPELFEPRGHGGNEEGECQVCHAERSDIGVDADGVRKCALCVSLEELGRALGRADYLVLSHIPPRSDAKRGDWREALSMLGIDVALLDEHGKWCLEPTTRTGIEHATVLGLRTSPDTDLVQNQSEKLGCPVAAGLRFTANVTPRKGRDVAKFEDMQEASRGLKRLGVLRMDVDNLGHLFSQGFRRPNGKSLSTLARVASLSSMMALFFEGWVGKLCQRINDEAKTGLIYTIYSGGDDLFIVGAWDVLPGLAMNIRTDLSRFAAHNELVHASAGITLHGGKYPLYLAAEDAAGALEQAKDQPGKNALTFLGQALPWPQWDEAQKFQEELVLLVEDSSVGRSLLHVLQRMHGQYRDMRDELATQGKLRARNGQEQTVWGPYMWHSAYLLTRLAERCKGDTKRRVEALRDNLSAENFRAIEIVGLAARWAEALTRSEKQEKEVRD